MRVATHRLKGRDSIAIGVLVGVGGRYESDQNKGAAHFLEHIVFKGSKKYNCNQIKELIEGVGGALNAYTTEEQTCYFAKIPSAHLNRTFDILTDMAFYPRIPVKEVEKERTVILEEIKMYRDLPQYYVLDLLDELIWPNHPLGKSLAGTPESVGRMSRRDLQTFHTGHYAPRNIVIAACGDLDHRGFVRLVQAKTKNIRKNPTSNNCLKAPDPLPRPKTHFFRKNTEQMHLALGMLGLDINHKDKYALVLLNVILGGNMSSRLFNEVREKRGLAYSISSSAKFLKDTGSFTIRAGVDNKKLVDAVGVVLKELQKIRRTGVTQGEFARAKDFFLGQLLLEMEDTLEHMLWIGGSVLIKDRVTTIKEIIKDVRKLSPGDVKGIARDILKESRSNLAVVGPVNDNQEKRLKGFLGI
jgi:predicted Zn-dependent peptidase